MKPITCLRAWTDYPIAALGDRSYQPAPHRSVRVLAFDGDKYCTVDVGGIRAQIKVGYIYQRPGNLGAAPTFRYATLTRLPME